MIARILLAVDLPQLNGFTDLAPDGVDIFPYFDVGNGANRDCTLDQMLKVGLEGYIEGLKLEYVDTNTIRVAPGSAYIESSGRVLKLTGNDDTDPSLSASTWYHVYLFLNGSTVDTEISTTAPAAPFIGTARSKTSDTSRRYLGSFRTNASSQIQNFICAGASSLVSYAWRLDTGVVTRALSGGTASVNTSVSLANYVPPICRSGFVRLINLGNQAVFTDTDDSTGTDPDSSQGLSAFGAGAQGFMFHPLNTSQAFRYAFAPAPSTGGFYVDVYGFLLER